MPIGRALRVLPRSTCRFSSLSLVMMMKQPCVPCRIDVDASVNGVESMRSSCPFASRKRILRKYFIRSDDPRPLGLLNYVRIWHDNSGPGASASWFLKYLIVRDLQTMQNFHFICQRWLAVEKDDGMVRLLLSLSLTTEMGVFRLRLNVSCQSRVTIRSKNSPTGSPNRRTTVFPTVICGFRSFPVHSPLDSPACNAARAALSYCLPRCS